MLKKNENYSENIRFNATHGYEKIEFGNKPYELDPNYIIGVVFLFTVIGLLLYVNFFYNFSLKSAFIKIYHEPKCSFLKHCIVVRKKPRLTANNRFSSKNAGKNEIQRNGSNISLNSVFIDSNSAKSNMDISKF